MISPPGRPRSIGIPRREVNRACSGTPSISRLITPRYVLIDLEFETVTQAERLLTSMKQIWGSGVAGAALGGEPRTQILETMEVTQLVA